MRKSLLAVVAIVGLAVVGLTGCAESANTTACKLYADGYNQLADIVKARNDGVTTVTAADIQAQTSALPTRFGDAFQKATGDVAVAISNSRDLARGFAADPSNQDAGVAFFTSTDAVAKACSSAGASITLNKTK